jgi:transposase
VHLGSWETLLHRGGNRQLNTALHLIAVCQIRDPSPGEAYYQRKVAQAKTPQEARRSLKRHLSNVVYSHLATDHGKADRCASSPTRTDGWWGGRRS